MGYFINCLGPTDNDADTDNNPGNAVKGVHCTRDGAQIDVSAGSEVFEGDAITTDKGAGIAVVFSDNSCVTLRESSSLTVRDYGFPSSKTPTHLEVQDGNVFVSVTPRPMDAHFFIKTKFAQVEVKGTKFDVINNLANGSYTTSVAVTSGTVTLTPSAKGANAVDILSGTSLTATVANTNIPGYSGSNVNLSKGNISAAQIKTLESGAVSFAEFNVLPNGSVKIKTFLMNPDGTVTKTTQTQIGGALTSLSLTTTDSSNKIITKVTESNGKESIVQNNGTTSITEKISGSSGTLSVKLDPGTFGQITPGSAGKPQQFKGSLTVNADGSVTGTATDKAGDQFTTSTNVLANGTIVVTETLTNKNGSKAVQVVATQPNGIKTTTTTDFAAGSTTGTSATVATPLPLSPPPLISTPATINVVNPLAPVSP